MSHDQANIMLRSTSSASPPRQRPRITPFIWDRFTQRQQPEHRTLEVTERPNVRILKAIIDFHPDNEHVIQNRTMLTGLQEDFARAWEERTVKYAQRDFTSCRDSDYIGVSKFGRAHTASQFQRLPRPIFNAMFKRTHLEFDLQSSYVTILASAFRDLELDALPEYVAHRDHILRGFQRELGLDASQVKLALSSMITTHPHYAADFNLGFTDEARICEFGRHPFVKGVMDDLKKIGDAFMERYGPFYKTVVNYRRQCKPGSDERRDLGAALSWMASDIEHEIMRIIIDQVGTDNIVWKYDALVIPQTAIGDVNPAAFSSRMEDLIFDKLGIRVILSCKDMGSNSLNVVIPENELTESPYSKWKREFERYYFKLKNPPVFCRILLDGTLQDLNEQGFNHVTSEQPKDFISQWKADPEKRMYHGKTFDPPPYEPRRGFFNLWRGIAAAELPQNLDIVSIEPWMEHVRILMGGEQPSIDFIHKLIARKIQQPGLKSFVFNYIRSSPGVGKDVFANALTEILGKYNVARVTSTSDLMDKNSANCENKIVAFISEMNFLDNKKYEDQLKNLITSEDHLVEKKYVQPYFLRSCTDFFGFSNNFQAVGFQADDRRFHVTTALGIHANKAEYFDPLITWLKQPENQRAIYDFYMAMDISNFKPAAERPITSSFKDIAESSISPIDIFIRTSFPIWIQNAECGGYDDQLFKILGGEHTGILRIKTSVFHDAFEAVCDEQGWMKDKSPNSKIQFVKKGIKELASRADRFRSNPKIPVFQDIKSNGVRYIKFDIAGIKRYIDEMINADLGVENQDDNDDDEAPSAMAPGFTPGRGN